MKTLNDFDFTDKRVLVRTGMDAPLDEKGNVTDDTRIREAVPTIKYLLDKGARLVLMTKVGRPKGKVVDALRVTSIAKRLSELLGVEVKPLDDCVGEEVENAVARMKDKDVVLLENVLFHPEEETDDDAFAQKLARLGEIYVNDAFSSSHRNQTSLVGVPKYLPSCVGLLLEKEINALSRALENPERPFVAVLGGAKVSDKVKLIENLLEKVDKILIGGAMMFTFLKAQGLDVGKSLVENDFLAKANGLLKSGKIVLPVDTVEADKLDASAESKIVSVREMGSGLGLDIGPETVKLFKGELEKAKTVVWNGPMGVFELDKFASGTVEIANFIAKLKAATIIGGGDTISAAEKAGVKAKFSHVSTGGGAMLEFLEGKKLPGIAALENSK